MSEERTEASTAESAAAGPASYFAQTRDLGNSLLLVLPLLLVYEVGLFLTRGKTINGVDFVTVVLLRQWGVRGLLVFNGLLFLAGVLGYLYARHKGRFDPRVVVGVLLEATVYALLLGTVILFVMSYLPVPPGLQTGHAELGLFGRVFVSLGAGVNEELVFRLGLFSLLTWALGKFVPERAAALGAVVFSSFLFSLAHYAGPESFRLFSFIFRFLAGALFCLIFAVRGFAIAVYTHAIYDIYVLVFSHE
ncbi:MAG: CPBP family intramembrane metalloprotease [Planctomycetota bacterium]|nr:MAG: CPBP family intramembrane metalloprotease [Planctomycetota bacterium]